MSKRSRSRSSALALAASGLLLVVVAAACGGSSSAKAATGGATTTTAAGGTGRAGFAAAFAAYSTCMGQHGVKLPKRTPGAGGPRPTGPGTTGPGGGGGFGGGGGGFGGGGFGGGGFGRTPQSLPPGVTQSQYAAAQKACASKLPSFGGRGGFAGGANSAALTAYRSCMSDHGIKIPTFTPGSTTTTVAGSTPTTFDRNSPKFLAANKICAALLPSRTGATPTTTTAG